MAASKWLIIAIVVIIIVIAIGAVVVLKGGTPSGSGQAATSIASHAWG